MGEKDRIFNKFLLVSTPFFEQIFFGNGSTAITG